jgi:hypothetical protein
MHGKLSKEEQDKIKNDPDHFNIMKLEDSEIFDFSDSLYAIIFGLSFTIFVLVLNLIGVT